MKQSISKLFSIKAIIFVCSYLMLLSFTAYGRENDGDVNSLKPHAVVSSVSPTNNATGVAINSSITATFTNKMNPATITTATFTVSTGGSNIAGAVTYSGTTATFTPSSNLSYNTTYTATISGVKVAEGNAVGLDRALDNVNDKKDKKDKKDKRDVKDSEGNEMSSNYTWTFTTGAAPDTTPPTVSSVSPANNATGVAINSSITATFSEVMDAATINTTTFTIIGVPGTASYSGTTATFTPSSNFSYSTIYTATITTGVKDAAGNPMVSSYTWSFTTGAAPDTTPPTVSSVSPANNATGVAINSSITATFSEIMDAATITTATFTVSNGGSNIAGTVIYSGTTATFTPSASLAYSTTYTATITTGVKDAAGNAMANNYTWTLATVTTTGVSQYDGTYTGSWSLTCPVCGDTAAGTFSATVTNGAFTSCPTITSGTHGIACFSGTVSSSGSITGMGVAPVQCPNSVSSFTGQIAINSSGGTDMTMQYSRLSDPAGCEAEYGTLTAAMHQSISNGTWSAVASMPTPQSGSGGEVNGKLYVAGGSSPGYPGNNTPAVQVYDPLTNIWATAASMPTQRGGTAASAINGKLYLAGGCINNDCRIGTTNLLQVYDPATNAWTTKTPMPTARFGAAAGVINGKLYVAGGSITCPPCGALTTLEVYDPATDTWTTKTSMPTARAQMSAAVVNGKLYVIGGMYWPSPNPYGMSTEVPLDTVQVYDPATDTWSAKAALPMPRRNHAVAAINGIIFIMGGQDGTTVLSTVYAYDTATNTWTTASSMGTARYNATVGVLNGRLYVAGGMNASSSTLNTVEAFTP